MKTVYKIFEIVCYVMTVLLVLLGLLMIYGKEVGIGVFFVVFGLVFVLLGRYCKKYAAKKYSIEKPAPASPVNEIPHAPKEARRHTPVAKYKPAEDCEAYNFSVTGVYYHRDEIIEGLMEENPEYEYTKKEIKENGLEDTYLYKYSIAFADADLVPEPDNPHDPDAIKVIADGVFVGYVPAKETKAVRKITNEKEIIKTRCQVYGGEYKVLNYDDSSIRRGTTDLKAIVSIKYK